MVEQCWEGDTIVSLPDLNTESTDVQGIWNDWIKGLVSNYSSKSIFQNAGGLFNAQMLTIISRWSAH